MKKGVGSGSAPKCHGSLTLDSGILIRVFFTFAATFWLENAVHVDFSLILPNLNKCAR